MPSVKFVLMVKLATLVCVACLLVLAPAALAAPPGNDSAASPGALPVERSVQGTTVDAVDDYHLLASCFPGGETSDPSAGRDVVYEFTAPSAGIWLFTVRQPVQQGSIVLALADALPAGPPPQNVTSGLCQAANHGTSGELLARNLSAGEHVFVLVDNTNAAALGAAFVLDAERNGPVEAEANDTPGTANPIGCQMRGFIGNMGGVDFFSLGNFPTAARVYAIADGSAATPGDYDLRVTSTTDTLEYDDSNADVMFGGSAPVIAGTPVVGAAFLSIQMNTPSQTSFPYRITFAAQTAPPAAETEPNDTPGQANSADRHFSGTLPGPFPSTDVDVFAFTATAGNLVFLALDGDPDRNTTPLNGKLELLDSSGSPLVSVNDPADTTSTAPGSGTLTATTPSSPAEGLTYRVPATGTYYARVATGANSGPASAGNYVLSIARGCSTAAAPAIAITPDTLPSALATRPYEQTLIGAGGAGPYSFDITSGALPSGVTLAADGKLSGTPTGAGDFTFRARAIDADGFAGSREYTLTVQPAPTVTVSPATIPDGTVGSAYSALLSATGGRAPHAFDVASGTLPPGLLLNGAGALSGTPTSAGQFTFAARATDADGFAGSREYTLTVRPAAQPPDRIKPRITKLRARKKGRLLTFTLSERATVHLTIQKRTARGKLKRVGKVRKLARPKGKNSVALKLKPGRYRATLIATDAAGNRSNRARRSFRRRK